MNGIMIYVTVETPEQGEAIARSLLEERLVACANIVAPHRALYHWQGQIETAQETVIILKTRADLYERVQAAILACHGYQCPCIVAWPITAGYQPYLDWIGQETGS